MKREQSRRLRQGEMSLATQHGYARELIGRRAPPSCTTAGGA